jgi:hypothetical protein
MWLQLLKSYLLGSTFSRLDSISATSHLMSRDHKYKSSQIYDLKIFVGDYGLFMGFDVGVVYIYIET